MKVHLKQEGCKHLPFVPSLNKDFATTFGTAHTFQGTGNMTVNSTIASKKHPCRRQTMRNKYTTLR